MVYRSARRLAGELAGWRDGDGERVGGEQRAGTSADLGRRSSCEEQRRGEGGNPNAQGKCEKVFSECARVLGCRQLGSILTPVPERHESAARTEGLV